jgi:hypothetical protein
MRDNIAILDYDWRTFKVLYVMFRLRTQTSQVSLGLWLCFLKILIDNLRLVKIELMQFSATKVTWYLPFFQLLTKSIVLI